MAEYLNSFHLSRFAGILADVMGLPLPDSFAAGIPWVSDLLKKQAGGTADRLVLYHADAVGQYIWQKYTSLFAPVYAHTSLALPFVSTIESVTPVAHASMYTGLEPPEHGIQTYVRPQLTCLTLYDILLKAGLRPCILAETDSTFLHIFKGRPMDYFVEETAVGIQEKALELIDLDKYDLLSIHTFDYDSASHAYGPESKEALNALSLEAEGFDRISCALEKYRGKHRTVISYSPDHGQHRTPGGTGAHGSTMSEDMNILHFFGTIS